MASDIAHELIETLYAGTPALTGCRVNHARGILVEGRFQPSAVAKALFNVDILVGPDLPVVARFSSSTGNPDIREDDPHANPRGLAIKIGDRPELVLVGHSAEAFPARDPEEFLGFLQAVNKDAARPGQLDRYVRQHAAARYFEAACADMPSSFAALRYHMLHPYQLNTANGQSAVGRLSVAGVAEPPPQDPAAAGSAYLDLELRSRLARGPVELLLVFQPAAEDDLIADVSTSWSAQTGATVLGRVLVERIAPEQVAQRSLVFDPAVLPDGLAFAGDPMIAARLASYRLAARRRLDGRP